MTSVHSNHRPWTDSCCSLASCSSASTLAMVFRRRFRRGSGFTCELSGIEGLAFTTVSAPCMLNRWCIPTRPPFLAEQKSVIQAGATTVRGFLQNVQAHSLHLLPEGSKMRNSQTRRFSLPSLHILHVRCKFCVIRAVGRNPQILHV